jgi:hypothetical protein
MAEATALQQRIHPGETMIGVSVSRERTRVQSGGWRTADVTCGSRWKVRTSGSVIDVTAPTCGTRLSTWG